MASNQPGRIGPQNAYQGQPQGARPQAPQGARPQAPLVAPQGARPQAPQGVRPQAPLVAPQGARPPPQGVRPQAPLVAPQRIRPQSAQNDFCQSTNKNISNKFLMKCNLYNTVFKEHIANLEKLYNCRFTMENKLLTKPGESSKICGETFIFKIIPNDCNYEIRIANHTSFENCDRKQTDEIIQFYVNRKDEQIESGFYACYKIKDSKIQHIYQADNPNPSSQDNYEKIVNDFSETTFVFNPYLFLNSINRQLRLPPINSRMQFYEIKENIETINLTRLLEQINNTRIIDIDNIYLIEQVDKRKALIESFNQCKEIFENPSTKRKYDKKLSSYIPIHHSSVHDKQISIDSISNVYIKKKIYETNYQAKNHLANTLAQYYPDFEFKKSTKSIKKGNKYFNYTYINTIKNILFRPFTATNLFVYKFPRIRLRSDKEGPHIHYNKFAEQYSQDIFNIKTPQALSRAFDLIEMSKSFIFTFVSTVLNVINNCGNTHRELEQSGQKDSIDKMINIPVRIFNVYPNLPWVNRDDNTEYLVSSNTLQINATFNFKKGKDKDKYEIKEYVNSPASDQLNGINFKIPTVVLPCLEAPYKKFDAIKELDVSDKDKKTERIKVYQNVIQGKNNTDGFENTLLEDENVLERLRQGLQNHKLNNGKIREIYSEYFLKAFIESTEDDIKEEPNKIFEFIEADFPDLPGSSEEKRQTMETIRQNIIDSQRRAAEAKIAEAKIAEAIPVEESSETEEDEREEDIADSSRWVHNIENDEEGERTGSKQSSRIKDNLKQMQALQRHLFEKKSKLYDKMRKLNHEMKEENESTVEPTESMKIKIQAIFKSVVKPLDKELTKLEQRIKDKFGKNIADIFFQNPDKEQEKILINLKQDLRLYDRLKDASPNYRKIYLAEKILSEIELMNIFLQEEEVAQTISDRETGSNRKQKDKKQGRDMTKRGDGKEKGRKGDRRWETKYLKYKAKYLALKQQYNL